MADFLRYEYQDRMNIRKDGALGVLTLST